MSDLQQAIANENVDTLKKKYLTYFGVKPKLTRKADLTKALADGFSDQGMLKAYLAKLSDLEMTLLREAVFNYGGRIDRARFTMKYGQFPDKPQTSRYYSYDHGPTDEASLCFFTVESNWYRTKKIPLELFDSLIALLEPPKPDTLPTSMLPDVLPEQHVRIERERLALSELHSMLILLQNKQLKVSDKTGVASGATVKKVSADVHEYYDYVACDEAKGMDTILSYGWLRLLGNTDTPRPIGRGFLIAQERFCFTVRSSGNRLGYRIKVPQRELLRWRINGGA